MEALSVADGWVIQESGRAGGVAAGHVRICGVMIDFGK